jgi:glycine cleavage system transcriptional repressor
MDTYRALISVYSKDRIGLISEVTGQLFSMGINLGDSSFAILGSGGGFTSIIEIPEDLSSPVLVAQLKTLPELKDADIEVKSFNLPKNDPSSFTEITHYIKCEGVDQPGLLARLSEVFLDFDANIVRLKSDHLERHSADYYVTRFSVHIPPERSENCLASLTNTAEGLGQKLVSEKLAAG